MALSRISDFEFFALSTDVEDSKIPGLSVIGAKVFFTDTQAWSVVQGDLTLADYILPVSITGGPGGGLTDEELRATPVPVTGEFSITGALTDAELRAAPIEVTGDFTSDGLTDTQLRATPVPVSGPLTDAQLRASVVPVRTDPTSVTGIYESGRTASVTAANALKVDASGVTQPVSGPLTDTQLRATAVPVSLSSVPSHAVTGPLTDTQLRATAVPVSLSSVPSHAVTGPLTDAQLRATAVPTSVAAGGNVTEGNTSDAAVITDTTGTLSGKLRGLVKWAFERMPASLGQKLMAASLPVVIASDQSAVTVSGTVTASGPLTDTQLRATAVPVSLSSVPSHAVTGPLTDTQLRATPVPVSGTVTASGPLTDTQLRATAVPVSGTVTANLSETDNSVLDAIAASNAAIQTAVESTGASAVSAGMDTSQMFNGLTTLTPKYAVINASTNGDNTVVAAVVGKKVRVLAVTLISAGTTTVRFESGAGGTALTGAMPLTAQCGFSAAFCPVGHFETGVNTLLNLELNAAVGVTGWLTYVEV